MRFTTVLHSSHGNGALPTLALAALALAGCSPYASVREIKPRHAGVSIRVTDPLTTLDVWLGAAETAWKKLDRNPADAEALGDYNFAVARV